MHLVALVGFKGSGKDTAGSFLENYGFKSFSFAESLKDALASIFCWDRALLEGDTKESREWRETVDQWWSNKLGIPDFTPRMAMQQIGTEVFRQHFNNDLWILNIERKLSMLPADAKVVLCDGRFPNELKLARKFGGKVVRVKRGPEPEWFEVAKTANYNGLTWHDKIMADAHTTTAACIAHDRMDKEFKVHQSEWAWIGQPLDETINNDLSISHLHAEVIRICL
jgi:hypothetical protein